MNMKSILVVDDERVMCEVLQRILTRLGYEIAVSDSWESALEMFSKKKFDLVLLDILMPRMNGYRIAKEMRQLKPDQKIVMVTGLCVHAALAYNRSTRIKVNDILIKPFTFDKLRSVVTKILDV